MLMRRTTMLALAVTTAMTAGACSRHNNTPADTTLNNDLSLAAQQRGYQPLDSLSAAERAAMTPNPLAPTSAATSTAPVRRTATSSSTRSSSSSTRRRSSGTSSHSSSSGSSGSVGTT